MSCLSWAPLGPSPGQACHLSHTFLTCLQKLFILPRGSSFLKRGMRYAALVCSCQNSLPSHANVDTLCICYPRTTSHQQAAGGCKSFSSVCLISQIEICRLASSAVLLPGHHFFQTKECIVVGASSGCDVPCSSRYGQDAVDEVLVQKILISFSSG